MAKTLFTNVNILDCTGADPLPGEVLIDGDPLADVSVLMGTDNLLAVVKGGIFHKRP